MSSVLRQRPITDSTHKIHNITCLALGISGFRRCYSLHLGSPLSSFRKSLTSLGGHVGNIYTFLVEERVSMTRNWRVFDGD